jgi:hypothetical protein
MIVNAPDSKRRQIVAANVIWAPDMSRILMDPGARACAAPDRGMGRTRRLAPCPPLTGKTAAASYNWADAGHLIARKRDGNCLRARRGRLPRRPVA